MKSSNYYKIIGLRKSTPLNKIKQNSLHYELKNFIVLGEKTQCIKPYSIALLMSIYTNEAMEGSNHYLDYN